MLFRGNFERAGQPAVFYENSLNREAQVSMAPLPPTTSMNIVSALIFAVFYGNSSTITKSATFRYKQIPET